MRKAWEMGFRIRSYCRVVRQGPDEVERVEIMVVFLTRSNAYPERWIPAFDIRFETEVNGYQEAQWIKRMIRGYAERKGRVPNVMDHWSEWSKGPVWARSKAA